MTTRMLSAMPDVTAHFSRFRVTEIALSAGSDAQFATAEVLRAAELLADARCDAIAWSGTASGWLGFETDARLCREITRVTGAPACTSVLALNEALERSFVRRLALVTPYRPDVQARIVANYAAIGVEVVAERHWNLQDNYSFSTIPQHEIAAAVRDVAASAPDAVAIFCTNLRGAALAADLEHALGLPVFDTVATAVWKALPLCGRPTAALSAWGRLFDIPGAPA